MLLLFGKRLTSLRKHALNTNFQDLEVAFLVPGCERFVSMMGGIANALPMCMTLISLGFFAIVVELLQDFVYTQWVSSG